MPYELIGGRVVEKTDGLYQFLEEMNQKAHTLDALLAEIKKQRNWGIAYKGGDYRIADEHGFHYKFDNFPDFVQALLNGVESPD